MLLPTSEGDRVIGIVRAHLEEDAAKTLHVGGRTGRIGGADYSLVDFNRGGTPLVEIVTAPDLRSADEAKRFLQLLRQTIVELGISDAEMEKGTLRVDANVSVRPAGSDELRTRTELKNMNSFNFVARGIEAEIERQIAVWESGGEVKQETYDFEAATGALTPRRAKEEADDYRYFPEPDLVPVEPPAELVERAALGAARAAGRADPPDRERARPRPRDGARHRRARLAVAGDGRRGRREGRGRERDREQPRRRRRGARSRSPRRSWPGSWRRATGIPRAAFDEAIAKLGEPGFSADPYLAQEAVSDTDELEPIVARILAANPGQVEAFRGRQGRPARLLRGPGHEGDAGQGERRVSSAELVAGQAGGVSYSFGIFSSRPL